MTRQITRALQAEQLRDELAAQDLITQIKESLAPCQPGHPFLTIHRLQHNDVQIYTGIKEIDGVQCHGAIALPIFNTEGEHISFALLAKTNNHKFASIVPKDVDWTGGFARIGTPSEKLFVSIDWEAGMSTYLASGHAVAVVFQENNLRPVCQNLKAKYPDKEIIVCDDLRAPTMPGIAEEIGASLALPYQEGDYSTFSKLHRYRSIEAVARALNATVVPGEKGWNAAMLGREVWRLSHLSEIDYEQQRIRSAKTLDVRAQFIDKKVEEARAQRDTINLLQPEDSLEPYEKAVDGSDLFQELYHTIRRFTVLTSSACTGVVLWVIFSYLISRFKIAPILGLVSPVKRCGKTTLLTLLQQLCFRPLSTSNITPAALYRCISQSQPTLLIDEADTFIHASSELNGIVNSGHTSSNAYVMRVVDSKAERFSTFCAKAIAVIGGLPETMQDRTIVIPLRRKRANERVESIRNTPDGELRLLRSKILRWTIDNAAQMHAIKPSVQGVSNDRAIDNWEPLIAIANQLGEPCLAAALAAASELSSSDVSTRSLAEELLSDVHNAFESASSERITSANLIVLLCSDDERPWATYDKGRPISSRQLAGLLATFKISSKNLRVGPAAVVKGYELASFSDAFERYLSNRTHMIAAEN